MGDQEDRVPSGIDAGAIEGKTRGDADGSPAFALAPAQIVGEPIHSPLNHVGVALTVVGRIEAGRRHPTQTFADHDVVERRIDPLDRISPLDLAEASGIGTSVEQTARSNDGGHRFRLGHRSATNQSNRLPRS